MSALGRAPIHVMIIEDSDDDAGNHVTMLHPTTCAIDIFATTHPHKAQPPVDIQYRCAVQFEIDNNGYMDLCVGENGGSLCAGMYAVEIEFYSTGGWEFPGEVDSAISVTRLVEEVLHGEL